MSDVHLLDDAKLSRMVGVRFVSLVVPVTVTVLLVVWSVTCLSPIYVGNGASPLATGANESDTSGGGERAAYSILTAVLIAVYMMALTFVIVLLYRSGLQFILYGLLGWSAGLVFFGLTWVWLDLVCTYFQIPYSFLSMGFIVWNIGVVGFTSLFYYSHPAVTQMYLILISFLITWSMTSLHEWTTWALLVCMATYDIFAVMWRQGPLHRLIEAARQRNEPIPGFIYNSAHVLSPLIQQAAPPSPSVPSAAAAEAAEATMTIEDVLRSSSPFQLGLGDFIFYSLLVGRASHSGFVPWTFCLVSVLTGMVGTLLSLLLFRKHFQALPALPCSIFLAIAVFVLCILLVQPLSSFASHRLLVF